MQRGSFLNFDFAQYIVAFQLVGYSVWNGEAAGSNPAYYTNGLFV